MTTAMSTDVVATAVDYLPHNIDPKSVEQALLIGDLSKMTDEVRIAYYIATCRSVGLNPLTKPFQALQGDDGRMSLYPDKGCAEQLRKLHRVSVKVIGREFLDDLYIVTVLARTPDGREEEAQGVVPIAKAKGTWEQTREGKRYFKAAVDADGREIMLPLSVAERANALKRAETQAKRRVTLAICGLGMPDWEGEPTSLAHPMALNLQTPPGQAGAPSLAQTIADLSDPLDPTAHPARGVVPPRETVDDYLAQIEAAVLAQPTGDMERSRHWAERQFAKEQADFTLEEYQAWLAKVREVAQERATRSHEEPPSAAGGSPEGAGKENDLFAKGEPAEKRAEEFGNGAGA